MRDFSVSAVAARLDRAYGGMDNRQVAAVLLERAGYETSYESVRRARKAIGQTIPHDLIAASAEAFGVPVDWLLTGEGAQTEDERDAEVLFEHFEGLVRRMGGEGIDPQELRLRKLDVIEGLKRLYGAAGGVPGWVYRLASQVAAEGRPRTLDDELDEDVRRLNQALGDEGEGEGWNRGAGGVA